jgi:nucleoside-diphosphate-sugar epimerase
MIEDGWVVTVLDNLSRAGTERNLKWLITEHPAETTFIKEDVRNASALAEHVKNQDAILHLAGQVAVTTSLIDPITDFDVNAGGTLNLLEAARHLFSHRRTRCTESSTRTTSLVRRASRSISTALMGAARALPIST